MGELKLVLGVPAQSHAGHAGKEEGADDPRSGLASVHAPDGWVAVSPIEPGAGLRPREFMRFSSMTRAGKLRARDGGNKPEIGHGRAFRGGFLVLEHGRRSSHELRYEELNRSA